MATSDVREALHGMEERLFKLVAQAATPAQWAEWLRVPLEHAAAENDQELAFALLKAGADGGAGWRGCNGRTLLQAGAEGGNEELVSALLGAGGSKELNYACGDENTTALHRAVAGGHAGVARVLILDGADVNRVDSRQHSVLHSALKGRHLQVARDVVIAGADLNARTSDGDTALHLAAAHNDPELIATLSRRGASLDVFNKGGACALLVAIKLKHVAVADALLRAGADPNTCYGSCGTLSPLFAAIFDVAMVKTLLEHGAAVNRTQFLGLKELHWAALNAGSDVINVLIEAGTDLHVRSTPSGSDRFPSVGWTPLHCAAFGQNVEAMAALLTRGANINAVCDEGETPLHLLGKFPTGTEMGSAADFLLRKGADETITNNDGDRAVDLIDYNSRGTERSRGDLRRLLIGAPRDRVWRRRGMLVMCRAHCDKHVVASGDGRPGKSLRQGNEVGASDACGGEMGRGRVREKGVGASDAPGSRGKKDGGVLERVVGVQAEAIFRTIVCFL